MSFSVIRFKQLERFLLNHKEYWQFLPFEFLRLPWWNRAPDLCHWLSEQSLEQLQNYKEDPIALAKLLTPWIPELVKYQELTEIFSSKNEPQRFDLRLQQGVPGRKWQQIEKFTAGLPTDDKEQTLWLEWCAGKGYLGRSLAAARKAKITSLEWQSDLCFEGADFARRAGLDISFVQADAFAASSIDLVQSHDHAVALHACGDLHSHLLMLAAKSGLQSVTISPCCYHLIKQKNYQPLSKQGKSSSLSLTKHCLKLPLQETVTAGRRVQKLRFIEVSFRLGFDCLQRSLLNNSAYLPLPNIKKSELNHGFEAFCHWAAQQKNMSLPKGIDFNAFEYQGQQRFLLIEQMEVIRTLFKRPLELWLAYDKVIYMQEQGFTVSLSEFCERQLTPRNLMISCVKSSTTTKSRIKDFPN